VKLFGGEVVKPGYIIIRQRGMKYKSGTNTKIGRDHTIYAISEGWVKFIYDKHKKTQTVTVSPMNPHIRPKLDQEKSADCKLIP
jgi:large subunit ribosomal protein L27